MKANKKQEYEQFDFFYEDENSRSEAIEYDAPSFELWDDTRGRNIIHAQGRNGKDVKIYFDSLDQQYHLFDE